MKTEKVFSPHVFRSNASEPGELPIDAPLGFNFFLSSRPTTTDKMKRYFVEAPRGGKGNVPSRVVTCLHAGRAHKFTNLRVAESFAQFLNNQAIFPNGAEFFITMERVGYAVESRSQLTCLAEA